MAVRPLYGNEIAMKILFSSLSLLLATVLTGCSSTPAPPAWQSSASSSLQSFSSAYLSGNTRVADLEFARARTELAATGRADLVAQAELIRCAARVASLEIGPCTGFQAIADDVGPAERTYAAYIAGRWQDVDPALLPAHHRAVVNGPGAGKTILGDIEDPFSRLVAAGALLQYGRLTPADMEIATETASSQGWRRPLLAWLGVQAQRAQQAGALDAYARIQRRIELVSGKPK